MIDNLLSWMAALVSLFAVWILFFIVFAAAIIGAGVMMRPLGRRIRIPDWANNGVIVVGAIIAIITVTWFNCAVLMELSRLYPRCRALGF